MKRFTCYHVHQIGTMKVYSIFMLAILLAFEHNNAEAVESTTDGFILKKKVHITKKSLSHSSFQVQRILVVLKSKKNLNFKSKKTINI